MRNKRERRFSHVLKTGKLWQGGDQVAHDVGHSIVRRHWSEAAESRETPFYQRIINGRPEDKNKFQIWIPLKKCAFKDLKSKSSQKPALVENVAERRQCWTPHQTEEILIEVIRLLRCHNHCRSTTRMASLLWKNKRCRHQTNIRYRKKFTNRNALKRTCPRFRAHFQR